MTRPTYITLSSIPPRFPYLAPILQSLLDQQGGPIPILLYIPQRYRRFPEWDGSLPDVPKGVTIIRTEQDDGPATKVLPALRQFAGKDVNILFCDDDHIYPPDWLLGFLQGTEDEPDAVICMHGADLQSLLNRSRPDHQFPRAAKWADETLAAHLANHPAPLPFAKPIFQASGWTDTFLGRGGVMVRPAFFDDAVFDLPPVIWSVDDFWLSGHLESRGVPIWVDHRIPNPALHPCMHLIRPLVREVIEKHDRWDANKACVAWYRQEKGIWQPDAPDEQSRGAPRKKAPMPPKAKIRPPRWKRVLGAMFGR